MTAQYEDPKFPDQFCTVTPDVRRLGGQGLQRLLAGPSAFVYGVLNAGSQLPERRPDSWTAIANFFNDGNLLVRVVRGQRSVDAHTPTSFVGATEMAEVRVTGGAGVGTLDLTHDSAVKGYAGLRFTRPSLDAPWVPVRVTQSGESANNPAMQTQEFVPGNVMPHYDNYHSFMNSPLARVAARLGQGASELFDPALPRAPHFHVEVFPTPTPAEL